ncbi:PEBP-like protein [Hyphopichia burtonii NRRL Y-1933]|uniref:Large ribosomal subunit protein mL38 n=1 Tax=Hyphopichia burtonii NRRL Y-1933 TaxID=984485 RepID=A0A1E4REW2_9ASCO|nr:PEBP-like protein [Hyphopichia burtonii NRRL Y-1933]ODV65808.1 PEBP-like protein [Hyphopichia burtonii NRRL Y-1933]
MLRFPRLVRGFSSSSRSNGVWSEFSKRSSSLKIFTPENKSDIFNPINPAVGPASVKDVSLKTSYHSPELIDDTFQQAYDLLENEASKIYGQIDQETDLVKKNDLLIEAEQYNPEVLYNVKFHSDKLDLSQPVYKHFTKKQWENKDLMLTMQRLETLKMIPDTLPTLDPKCHIQIKFPHNTDRLFSNWITPGEILPAFAVNKPPTIKIIDFDNLDNSDQLYTILIVNPDVPDLSTNSFKTCLNYGLSNVKLNNIDNTLNTEKLLNHENEWCFKSYQPLTPEKNIPNQRACLWVLKQSKKFSLPEIARDYFNIREFTENFNLTPVGAHIWRQHFDRSVKATNFSYGLPKPKVFHRVRKDAPMV